jgi:hypothetical protein
MTMNSAANQVLIPFRDFSRIQSSSICAHGIKSVFVGDA